MTRRAVRAIRCAAPLALALSLWATPAAANPFGVGIVLGEPSGLSAKWFVNPRHAFQLGVDFSFVDDAIYVGLDYLRHFPGFVNHRSVTAYVGIGGAISVVERKRDEDEGRLQGRVPLGLAWMPRDPPLDIFLEVVPILRIVPDLDPGIAAGLGIRYWF